MLINQIVDSMQFIKSIQIESKGTDFEKIFLVAQLIILRALLFSLQRIFSSKVSYTTNVMLISKDFCNRVATKVLRRFWGRLDP